MGKNPKSPKVLCEEVPSPRGGEVFEVNYWGWLERGLEAPKSLTFPYFCNRYLVVKRA